MDNKDIFIAIPSASDKELNLTIQSAIQNAHDPSRLYFGIFLHNLTPELVKLCDDNANIIAAQCYFPEKLGIGIPRTMAAYLQNQKQKYTLQIDPHMIFQPNWDEDLINAYESLLNVCDKPIISTYVPWWYRDTDGVIRRYDGDPMNLDDGEPQNNTTKLKFKQFKDSLGVDMPVIDFEYEGWENEKTFVEHYLVSGHFMFFSSDFYYDLAVDPRLTWNGEELVIALRAWTRGYRMFAIKKSIVWHKSKWTKGKDGGLVLDPGDWREKATSTNPLMGELFHHGMLKTKTRVKDIFLGNYLEYWGAPSMELLKEYEEKTNVKFADYYNLHKEYLKSTGNKHLLKEMYGEE